jgi:hypothetical protein
MAKIPSQVTAPIEWNVPIVNTKDGTMTQPFRRLMQALTGNGSASGDVVQQLIDAQLQQGSGISILPDGHLLSNPTISAEVQAILDQISNTRGVVLYRGASGWAALSPGTANFFLQTQGAGADPLWAASTANIQTLLDGISATQGVVLYRGASAWVALSPGTVGYFLQTQGAGADPVWAAGGGGGGGAYFRGFSTAGGGETTFSSAFAGRAMRFTSRQNLSVIAVDHIIDPAATSETYVAYLLQMSNNTTTATISAILGTSSTVNAVSTTASMYRFPFASPVSLSSGSTIYALAVFRTDSTGTAILRSIGADGCGAYGPYDSTKGNVLYYNTTSPSVSQAPSGNTTSQIYGGLEGTY